MPDNFLGKKVSDKVPIIIGASGTGRWEEIGSI